MTPSRVTERAAGGIAKAVCIENCQIDPWRVFLRNPEGITGGISGGILGKNAKGIPTGLFKEILENFVKNSRNSEEFFKEFLEKTFNKT